jgi:rhodanese-related sulfurtransferase
MAEPRVVEHGSFTSYVDPAESFERISAYEFCRFADAGHPGFARMVIVDARTETEYEAGHIKDALNCHPWVGEPREFFARHYAPDTIFVIHCEFSQIRGPATIKIYAEENAKAGRAPEDLHAVVLDGGFACFFFDHRDRCEGFHLSEAQAMAGKNK